MTGEGIQSIYNHLFESGLAAIEEGTYQTDSLLDAPLDDRLGMTLLIRLPEEVKEKIQNFLNELNSVDAEQYYYPWSDLHITFLSIISCYNGFNPEKLDVEPYIALIEKILNRENSFKLDFQGITLSPSCVMIQGFAENDRMNGIREKLRQAFSQSNLFQTIDSRYRLVTSHSTVVRYRKKLANPSEMLDVLKKYRNSCFGSFPVNSVELVFNDWYQRKIHNKLICNVKLK